MAFGVYMWKYTAFCGTRNIAHFFNVRNDVRFVYFM